MATFEKQALMPCTRSTKSESLRWNPGFFFFTRLSRVFGDQFGAHLQRKNSVFQRVACRSFLRKLSKMLGKNIWEDGPKSAF